jgi:large subunit ribosomal protein L17
MALYRNLVTELLRHDRITTTEAKAKEIRPMAEKIITLGRRGDLHARRQAQAFLYDTSVVKKVFDEIGPAMKDRPGGYLRITGLEPRKGDGAKMAAIELVTYVNAPPTPRPARVTAAPSAASAAAAPVAAAPALAVEAEAEEVEEAPVGAEADIVPEEVTAEENAEMPVAEAPEADGGEGEAESAT